MIITSYTYRYLKPVFRLLSGHNSNDKVADWNLTLLISSAQNAEKENNSAPPSALHSNATGKHSVCNYISWSCVQAYCSKQHIEHHSSSDSSRWKFVGMRREMPPSPGMRLHHNVQHLLPLAAGRSSGRPAGGITWVSHLQRRERASSGPARST